MESASLIAEMLERPTSESTVTVGADGTERELETPVRPAINPVENAVEDVQAQMPVTIVPLRKRTQEDQDDADNLARRKAMKDLVQSWMDRLQLISVITTFFASVEAGLLQVTTPDSTNNVSSLNQAASASLVGALIMHVFAAIISFLAAFFLVRYKLAEAKKAEEQVEEHNLHHVESPDMEKGTSSYNVETASTVKISSSILVPMKNPTASEPPIWSTNPHLEQVGPFQRKPPAHLLGRCHLFCVFLASVGFLLALTGIILYVWARHPRGVGVFASVCMASCVVGGVGILVFE